MIGMTGSLLLTPPVARPAHLWYHPLRKETGKVVGYHGNESKAKGKQFYLTQARELGLQFGDSPELSQLCRAAYEDYGHLHWLILDHCIQHCKKSPQCQGCCFATECPTAQKN